MSRLGSYCGTSQHVMVRAVWDMKMCALGLSMESGTCFSRKQAFTDAARFRTRTYAVSNGFSDASHGREISMHINCYAVWHIWRKFGLSVSSLGSAG